MTAVEDALAAELDAEPVTPIEPFHVRADRAALFAALARAQGAFPAIPRTREVTVQTKTGGKYSFRYAPLDTVLDKVRPALTAEGLAVTQVLDVSGPDTLLRTMLLHADGGTLESAWPIRSGGTPQEFGSALTYLRRYTLVALLGIASEEDDDGNHASGNAAQDAPQKRTRTPRTPRQPETDAQAVLASADDLAAYKAQVEDAGFDWAAAFEALGADVTADTLAQHRQQLIDHLATLAEQGAL